MLTFAFFFFFCFGLSCQDNEKRTPLHAAAYLGDAEIIELLILSGRLCSPAYIYRSVQPSIRFLWTIKCTFHLSLV